MSALERLAGKKRIKVLFVRPPHHYWPINTQSAHFLIPLNSPTLAGWLRERLEFVDVEILDCCVEQVGYEALRDEIRALDKQGEDWLPPKLCRRLAARPGTADWPIPPRSSRGISTTSCTR